MKQQLTNENVHTFKLPPEGKRKCEIPDSLITGLYLELRKSGKSTYWFRYTNRATNRLSHIKLGPGDALTLGQARAKSRTLRSQVALHGNIKENLEKQSPNYRDYILDTFLPWIKSINRPSSSIRNQSHFDLYLNDAFGSMKLSQIRKQDLVALQSKLMSEGKLKPASINRILSTCTGSFSRAVELGLIDRSPGYKFKLLKENNKSDVWLTREQADCLLKELPIHLRTISQMCLYTGLRSSNLTELTWSEVNLDRKLIIIGAEKAKGNRPITVPLIPEAIQLLNELQGQHEEYVFTYNGHPITRVTNSAWYKACERAGIKAKFHTLRHTWASWHVQAGTNLYDLQALGAWSDIRMVQRYGHLSAERVERSAHNISSFSMEETP